MNDLVQAQNTAVGEAMSQEELNAYYQQMAQAYAATEQTHNSTVSVKNGVMSVGDQPIPGNQFAAVILDAVRINTYYRSTYNPNSNEPPTCYAIGREDAEMAPHPDMAKDHSHFQPQAQQCLGCPLNEFGSNQQTGKGKACGNRRRLIMLLAGTYQQDVNGMLHLNPYTTAEHYKDTPFLQMSLAPTTLKAWGEFVRSSAAQFQRPFFGMVTRIYLYAHPVHGKEAIGFEPLAEVPQEWAHSIIPRQRQAMEDIFKGFEPPKNNHPQGGFHQVQQQAR